MTFSEALEILKKPRTVRRAGWNGKGMFLFLVQRLSSSQFLGSRYPVREFIAIKTAQDDVVPWVASHVDLLADDWEEPTR